MSPNVLKIICSCNNDEEEEKDDDDDDAVLNHTY